MEHISTRYDTISVFVLLICQITAIVTQEITLFELVNRKGKQDNLSISNCTDLPIALVRNVASVNTKNHCARLYDDTNCSGNFIDIYPNSPSHNDLKHWNFAGKTVSIGPCQESCSATSFTPFLQSVDIFNQEDFKGSQTSVHLNGCSPIPPKFVNSTMSINTNGHCIRVYSTANCDVGTSNTNSIELSPNSPHHNNLKFWKFPMIKSISPCTYSCDLPSKILNGYCFNFENDTKPLLQLANQTPTTCLTFFDDLNCTGLSFDVISTTTNSTLNFTEIKSIKRCLYTNEQATTPVPNLVTTFFVNQYLNLTSTSIEQQTEFKSSSIKPVDTFERFLFQGNNSTTKDETKSQQTDNVLSGLPSYIIMIFIVVPVASVLLSIFVIFCVLRKWFTYKRVMNKLSDKEIKEFLGGFEMDALANGVNTTIGNEYSTEMLAQNKPFNKEYEITRSRIQFDSDVPLGKGEFGVVYKGTVAVVTGANVTASTSQKTTDRITVAIKMINSSSGLHGLRSLLKEVKVMLFVGEHLNIARIIGCCTDNLRQGEIMVLTEFCSEGSLESYLSKHRHLYNNFVTNGRLEFQDESDTLKLTSKNFDIFQLAKWCAEIASGMEFLSNAKVVHSDLAARNILLNEMLEAKISDFGLSRQLYNYTQYMKKLQEPLPWRWMAIESLKCLEFSSKSDVWSYGVLSWEIFTLGEKPYPNLGWNESFVCTLENGLRLSQPLNSTTEFYQLMRRCWEENPSNRPSCTEILTEVHDLLSNYDAIQLIPCKIEEICIQIY